MKRLALSLIALALVLLFAPDAKAQFLFNRGGRLGTTVAVGGGVLPGAGLLPGRAFVPGLVPGHFPHHRLPGHIPGHLSGRFFFPRALYPPVVGAGLYQQQLLQQQLLLGQSYAPAAALGTGCAGGVPASALFAPGYGTGSGCGCGGGVPASALFAPGAGCGTGGVPASGLTHQAQFFFSTTSGGY